MAAARCRVARVVRHDGQEPLGLGDVIGELVIERTWEIAAAGVGLCEPLTHQVAELSTGRPLRLTMWAFGERATAHCV